MLRFKSSKQSFYLPFSSFFPCPSQPSLHTTVIPYLRTAWFIQDDGTIVTKTTTVYTPDAGAAVVKAEPQLSRQDYLQVNTKCNHLSTTTSTYLSSLSAQSSTL